MDLLPNLKESVIDGDWSFFCAVQTATHALDLAGFSEVPEMGTGCGEAFVLFRAHESPFLDEGSTCPLRSSHATLLKPLHL